MCVHNFSHYVLTVVWLRFKEHNIIRVQADKPERLQQVSRLTLAAPLYATMVQDAAFITVAAFAWFYTRTKRSFIYLNCILYTYIGNINTVYLNT